MCKNRRWKAVDQVLKEMNDAGVEPNTRTYSSLIVAKCNAKRFQDVKALLLEMEEKKIKKDERIYSSLLNMMFKAAKFDDMTTTLNEMKQLGIERARINGIVYSTDTDKEDENDVPRPLNS